MSIPTPQPFKLSTSNNLFGIWKSDDIDNNEKLTTIMHDVRALYKYYRNNGIVDHKDMFGFSGYTAGELCLYIIHKLHHIRTTRYQ